MYNSCVQDLDFQAGWASAHAVCIHMCACARHTEVDTTRSGDLRAERWRWREWCARIAVTGHAWTSSTLPCTVAPWQAFGQTRVYDGSLENICAAIFASYSLYKRQMVHHLPIWYKHLRHIFDFEGLTISRLLKSRPRLRK